MTTQRDYYDILEVSRDSTEEEIRKAFRKKALEFHPDRNKSEGAHVKFKEANEAYQVLTDPERRQRYDRFGHAGVGNGAQGQGFEGADLFGGFGDVFDAFFGGGGTSRTMAREGRDLQTTLPISFEEAAFGTKREIEIDRVEQCARCKGSRSEPGHDAETCSNCKGSGRVRRAQRSIFGQFVTEAACNVCNGSGQTVPHPCAKCKGSGAEKTKRKIQVKVPAGVPSGVRLRLERQGDTGEFGGPPGDLFVGIRVQPHDLFRREEDDVFLTVDVSFPRAALGTEIDVPTLDGAAKLKVPAGTQSNTRFKLKGQGIPHLGREGKRGDEIVTVRIETPDHLSNRQKELLEEFERTMGDDD
jgi:molecular chaperone DnaJ